MPLPDGISVHPSGAPRCDRPIHAIQGNGAVAVPPAGAIRCFDTTGPWLG
jgi:hypothetical protein